MSDRMTGYHNLEDTYFERMARSMGDKYRLFEYLPPVSVDREVSVLDVGAGGGELSAALMGLGYKVTALDASKDAIERLEYKYSNLEVIQDLANHVDRYGVEKYDAIICSSILHEVFSYGDDVHRAGHVSSLVRALEAFWNALKPGGVLLIRDGVLPDNWDVDATVTLLDGHENSSVQKYLDMCPFANGTAYGKQGTLVQLANTEGKTWAGNLRSVTEFAYTYTWGLTSYPRETQELYMPLTLNEYTELLNSNGFNVVKAYSYLQEGYPVNLVEKMVLNVQGSPAQWPDSNAIWVAVKQ